MSNIMAKIQTMRKIMAKIQRSKYHTITHQNTIKPSFPTPTHNKIYNLSITDRLNPNVHVPFVYFYKNYNNADINILKESLSKTLTQYYPFAGRLLTPSAPHITCNDEGVDFLEADINIPLNDFILKRDPDETINQLIPNSVGGVVNKTSPNMLDVQLTHFPCGGVAVAVSISHKVADAFTMTNFINHWATVTRGASPITPTFISLPKSRDINLPEHSIIDETSSKPKYVERRFVFPNLKLSELKNKINLMGTTPINPTRVESLSSLIFKCAVSAATEKSGDPQPSNLNLVVNMRDNFTTLCSKSTVGNIITVATAGISEYSQLHLDEVITSLRKARMELQGMKDVEELGERLLKKLPSLANNQSNLTSYICSSVCRIPLYQVNFGWGNPVWVIILTRNFDQNQFIFMDSASGDGVEAIVTLKEEVMDVLQNDKELLAYVQDMS